ncbi:MAG: ATP-binding protein [Bryobacteraceae bacterium]
MDTGGQVPLFKALIENSCDLIALVDPTGEMTYASASGKRVLGYAPNELVGRDICELIHPEDREASRRAIQQVLSQPPIPQHLESRVRHKDGEWCPMESITSNLMDEAAIEAIVITFRKITGRGTAPGKERVLNGELAGSGGSGELEHFAYAVAHDLREPLRTISMFTEILLESQLDENTRKLGQSITTGVARMAALLDGLQSLVIPVQENFRQPVDLDHVVGQALENLQPALTANRATLSVDPLPMVRGNEKQLRSILQNLIGNAIKYSGDAPLEIRVSAEGRGADWIIKVKDNGTGIAPEHQEIVFDRFQGLHGPEIPGAGLGLAICKRMIEDSGHKIWGESEPGVGSTFCFTAAAAEQPAIPPRAHDPSDLFISQGEKNRIAGV